MIRTDWEPFFTATLGAAAALAGLLVVAISINVREIIAFKTLPGRAAESIVLLMGVILLSGVLLMPGQGWTAVGIEVLVIGVGVWYIPLHIELRDRIVQHPDERFRIRVLTTQLATVPAVVAGALLMAESGAGLYLLAAGMGMGFVVAVVNAWVLLIEILR